MKRFPWKWLLALLILGLAGAGAWRSMSARKAQQAQLEASSSSKVQAVAELAAGDVVTAEPRRLTLVLPVSGSLRAVNTAAVKARVAGELRDLQVREGDTVKAGEVVARVDDTESRARLKQAQEQADSARAQIDIAQRQYDNNRAMVEQGFISRAALDTSFNNLSAAQANHKAALAAIDLARKALEDTVLRAPIAGVVAQRLAQPGERVGVDTRILEIVDLARLELEATLAAADSGTVRLGQLASLRVEGAAQPVTARVVRINPSAQAGSRSVLAYLAVAGAPGLRQGLFAQGTLSTGSTESVALPLDAVRTDKPEPYVQVVDGGRAVHRQVRLGARGESGQETWVAVEGLASGTVVTRGIVGPLREGTLVRFTASAPVPSASAGAAPAPGAPPAAARASGSR